MLITLYELCKRNKHIHKHYANESQKIYVI